MEGKKKKYVSPTIDVEEAVNHINRYSLPYGLCKGVGINTEGMTPREAWEAWEQKTGKTKEQAEKEHWGEDKGKEKKKEKDREEPKKLKELSDLSDTYNAPKWANSEETKKKIASAIDYVYSKYDLAKLKSVNVKTMKNALASAGGTRLNFSSSFLRDPEGKAKEGQKNFETNKQILLKWYEYKLQKAQTDKEKAEAQANLDRTKSYSRHNVIYQGEALQSVVAHELGHTLSEQYFGLISSTDFGITHYPKGWAPYQIRGKIFDAYKECLKNGEIYKISEYASKNVDEFFAESFAMKVMGREELPPTVKKLFEVIKLF